MGSSPSDGGGLQSRLVQASGPFATGKSHQMCGVWKSVSGSFQCDGAAAHSIDSDASHQTVRPYI